MKKAGIIESLSRLLERILWGILLVSIFPVSVLAAQADPAPIPDDAVQKLIPKTSAILVHPLPDKLQSHLEEALALLEQMEEENQSPLLQAQTTKLMFLSSKIFQLNTLRPEINVLFSTLGPKLFPAGSPAKLKAWHELRLKVEDRLDEILLLLENVLKSQGSLGHSAVLAKAKAELIALLNKAKGYELPAGPLPTLTQDLPTTQKPEPNNAPPPLYMSYLEDAPVRYAFLGPMILAALPPPTPAEASSCSYTAADLGQSQEVQITPEITALAEALSFSPVKIFQYVSNEIKFEPYYGSLKGAMGTLYSKAGNATDQASLLIALLRASNIPARYVKGVARFSGGDRLQRWVGAKQSSAAATILAMGQIPTSIDSVSGAVEFTHVWVEACVPYGVYRGTAVDLTGHRWIPLDPSFKDKIYQQGIATNVDFDYASYMSTRTHDLPHEKYAEQVESYIKTQPPSYANNTLEDVGYIGTIVPLQMDLLPASLPYEVVAYNAWDTGLTAETAELPDKHRYKFNITVKNSSGTALAPTLTLSWPEIVLQRITLSFRGYTTTDQNNLDTWKSNPDTTTPLPCSENIQVVPVVKVEGVDKAVGDTPVDLCTTTNQLTLQISLADIITSSNPSGKVNEVNFTNIQAADYHALLGYAFQTSDRLLTERAAKLLSSVTSTPNPNDNLEETEGEFLHLSGLKYMRYMADGSKLIGELDRGSGERGNSLGLTSSRMKVKYLLDQPFAVAREGFLVDFPGGVSRNVDLSTGDLVWKSFLLDGYTLSAYESYIWQENARLDAVSTVRGIQFANETGIEVLKNLTSANWAAEKPKLTSNSNSSLNYSSSQVADIETNYINNGYTITLPRSLIQYGTWKGYVFIGEKNNFPTSGSGAFIISGGYAGGYTVGPPVSPDYDPTLDTGFEPDSAPSSTGSNQYTVTSGDPVNMVNGNTYHTERDIAIKSRGLPLVFERSYNSRKAQDGPLGFGWTHSFNHFLLFKDDNANGVADSGDTDGITSSVSWTDGTGSEKFIQVAGDSSGVPIGSAFIPPQGFFFQTSRNADGTYTIREKNGLTYTFESVAGTVGQKVRLLSIKDRNNNTLTLNYTGNLLTSVTDSLNRSLTFTYDGNSRITQICDWTNRCHQYLYDASGNLVTYKNPLAIANSQNPVTYTYYSDASNPNVNHAMKSYALPRGNGMTFEYFINGKVFKHYNTLGETTTFTYNEFRRESISTNERGHKRQFFFDKFGNPTKIVEERGGERIYTYDPNNPMNRISKRDPMGYVTQYTYDSSGNVTKITNPSGSMVEYFNFNAFNQPGKIKDTRGNYTILKYDSSGNLLQTIKLKSGIGATTDPVTYTPSPGEVVAWSINTYDSFGNLLTTKRVKDLASLAGPTIEYDYNDTVNGVLGLNAVTITRRGDKNGDWTIDASEFDTANLTYDSLGRSTTGVRADWHTTQALYDSVDRVVQGTNDFGNLRDYAFDANGNLASNKLVIAGSTIDQVTYTYDLSDRKVSSTNAANFPTTYQYDAAGNVISTTNPDGRTLSFVYDPNNKIIMAYDEEGNAVSRILDLGGKPRTVTDPNGNTTSYEFYGPEREGRLKIKRDPIGRATTYDYDANGNVISVTDNLTRTTLTTYDELNRPTRIVGPVYTDASLGTIRPVTRYNYDLLGNLVQVDAGYTDLSGTNIVSDAVSLQMSYLYDDFGRKLQETDALGRCWTFEYDTNGNVTKVTDPKGQIITYTYGYGHQRLTRNANGSLTTYTRNALGQVTQAQSPEVTYAYVYDAAHRLNTLNDSRGNKTLTYTYSPAGLLNSFKDNDGNQTDYLYDAVGRLTGIWAPNWDLASFIYDNGGRLIEKWFPNGVNTQYVYKADNTILQLVNRLGSGTVLSQNDYIYDAAGNRVNHTEAIGGIARYFYYGYDELNRLVALGEWTDPDTRTPLTILENYSYDLLGNRTSKVAGGATTAYIYDAANQLTEIRSGNTTGPLLSGFVYDVNGNLTKKCEGGTVTRTDTDCTGSTITALTYDALNRLTQAAKTGISTQTYTYDDQGRRIQKSAGGATTNFLYSGPDIVGEYGSTWGSLTALYTHGPNMDDPIIRVAGTTAQYYHQDGLGSVVGVTNQSGATDGTARYDAWGNVASSTGSIPQYGYTGREPDETGLIYYRARYYDPSIGRFVRRDPIGFSGGLNLYAYVGNNPINFNDPMGLLPFEVKQQILADQSTTYYLAETGTLPGLTSGSQSLSGMGSGGSPDVFNSTVTAQQSKRPEDNTLIQLADASNFASSMTDAGGITVSAGVKVDLGFLGAGGGGTLLNLGYGRTQGFSFSLTGSWETMAVTGPAAGVQGIFQFTNLPSVRDLNGPFLSLGKSFQIPYVPVFFGGEGVSTTTGRPVGFTLFGGVGFRGMPSWPVVTTFTYSSTSTIGGWSGRSGSFFLTDR